MCCFSRPVRHVSRTRIFARPLDGGRQALVYAMRFAAAEDLAMVLPLPVARGGGEDAVRFVNLEGQPRFFEDLDAAFPPLVAEPSRRPGAAAASRPTLAVRQVGAFEASFVPAASDFDRLDPRFRLDPAIWQRLGDYAQHGFAVFKLRGTGGLLARLIGRGAARAVHPMALIFAARDPSRLFFPTVHVHQSGVEPRARFDHALYCQWDRPPAREGSGIGLGWVPSSGPIGPHLREGGGAGLIDAGGVAYRAAVRGERPNRDIYVERS